MMDIYLQLATAVDSAGTLPKWMQDWFDITHPWELWWLVLGVVAQLMFFGRWILQWFESERRGESYMPEIFWWLSLFGATLLLVYFVGRREPVGTLGQLTGWIVYGRNLYLIRAKKRVLIEDIPHDSGAATKT